MSKNRNSFTVKREAEKIDHQCLQARPSNGQRKFMNEEELWIAPDSCVEFGSMKGKKKVIPNGQKLDFSKVCDEIQHSVRG